MTPLLLITKSINYNWKMERGLRDLDHLALIRSISFRFAISIAHSPVSPFWYIR